MLLLRHICGRNNRACQYIFQGVWEVLITTPFFHRTCETCSSELVEWFVQTSKQALLLSRREGRTPNSRVINFLIINYQNARHSTTENSHRCSYYWEGILHYYTTFTGAKTQKKVHKNKTRQVQNWAAAMRENSKWEIEWWSMTIDSQGQTGWDQQLWKIGPKTYYVEVGSMEETYRTNDEEWVLGR